MRQQRSRGMVAGAKHGPVFGALAPITLAAACATVGCDAFMTLHVTVTNTAGVAVLGSQVTVTLLSGGRRLAQAPTSELGVVELRSSYAFRSGARILEVTKEGYKSYSMHLEPQPQYRCEVVLAPGGTTGLSTGRCVQE